MSEKRQPFTLSVEEILLTAMEKASAAERSAYLEEVCGHNAATREKVEGLLASYREDDFLEKPAVAVDPAGVALAEVNERLGSAIGRYKLLEQIGSAA